MKRRFKLIDQNDKDGELEDNSIVSPGDFFACYPSHDNDSLQFFVSKSKEFKMNTVLPGSEPTPTNPGEFYSYQRLFASLIFYYPRMLLLSEPGTGKSISFIEAVENSKRTGIIKRVIWLENSPNVQNDISRQIINKAVKPDIYYHSNKTNPSKRAERREILKELSTFYEALTYEGLESKYKISEMTDKQVIEEFSGVFIVADEAHHLTTQDGYPSKVYKSIERIVNTAKGVRLLLVSATIMTNSLLQIIPISDLLLPVNNRFTEDERKFIDTNRNSHKITEIIFNKLRNYTSYISANTSIAQPVFITKSWVNGEVSESYENQNEAVYYSPMSQYQIDYYIKYSNQEKSDKQDAVFFKSRQASTFAFPDGTIGGKVGKENDGVSNYVEYWKPLDNTMSLGRYKFKPNVFEGLDFKSDRNLEELGKLSSKFKTIIETELKSFGRFLNGSIEDAGTTMIYSEYTNGAGAILLSQFFERYGFADYRKGKGLNKDRIPKFALLTREAEDQIETVREVFNSKENVTGNKIRVLIVTKALRDGINLAHAIRAHILFPSWNEASEKQAMYRVIRADSHNALSEYRKSNGLTNPIKIQIYKHGAFIPIKPGVTIELSTDYIIYRKLFEKENQINLVLKGLKKGALDYFLTRNRNNQPWNDFNDFNEEERNSTLEVSTRNYNADFAIPNEIQSAFNEIVSANSNSKLINLINDNNIYYSPLYKFILNIMEIRGINCNQGYINTSNKMGIPFLSDRIGKTDYDDYYYKNTNIGNITRKFIDSSYELTKQSDLTTINSMIRDDNVNSIITKISRISSVYSLNYFIETCIIKIINDPEFNNPSFSVLYNKEGLNFNKYFRKGLKVKTIREQAEKIPGITKDNASKYILPGISDSTTIISNTLLQITNGIEVFGNYSDINRFSNRKNLIRILPIENNKMKWRYVLEGPETQVLNNIKYEDKSVKKLVKPTTTTDNEVGIDPTEKIYGKLNLSDGRFSIIDLRQTDTNTGRVCKTYKREELDEFILELIPKDIKQSEFIQAASVNTKFTRDQLDLMDSEGVKYVFKNKDSKCNLIKDILRYKKLLKTN